ncbi:MAG: hypothetical protein NTV51_19935 [Verrucomicrobia bacterium]|nr:hypothetical protein [Verrucomicrobiota bacterium]
MRLIRPILIGLTLAGTLAALLVAAAFVPAVQTWVVRRWLDGRPDWQVTVGSVSARPAGVRLANLRLQRDGRVLTVPALEATLPLVRAVRNGELPIETLVAKGWTLDLTREPAPAVAGAKPTSQPVARERKVSGTASAAGDDAVARQVMTEFRGLLGGWSFPGDTAVERVNLEGEVLLPSASGKGPVRMRVAITGGGLDARRVGEFTFEASGPVTESAGASGAVAVRGRMTVAMGSPRSVSRIELLGRLSAADGTLPEDLQVAARVAAAEGGKGEGYLLNVDRGERRLIAIAASLPATGPRLDGTWQLDVRESDLARWQTGKGAKVAAMTGNGRFEAEADFTTVRAQGHVTSTLERWSGTMTPAREPGAVTAEGDFAVVHAGRTLQIDRLDLAVRGARPIAAGRLTQPVRMDERTGAMTAKDPQADWLEGTLTGLPLAWLSGIVEGVGSRAGNLTGKFGLRGGPAGFAFQSNEPLSGKAITLQLAGGRQVPGLDLSLSCAAEYTSRGWQVKVAPLGVDTAGGRVAILEATVTPPTEANGPRTVTGKWNVDLEKLGALPAFAEFAPMSGRTTTGEFSASLGATTDVKATVNLVGTAPAHSITGNTRVIVSPGGRVTFQIPLTLTVGTKKTGVTAVGHWTREQTGLVAEVDLSGVEVDTDHLELLTPWWPAIEGFVGASRDPVGTAGAAQAVNARDSRAFWGDWSGRLTFSCYHLRTGDQELNEVAGTLSLDRGTMRLKGGRAVLAPAPVAPQRGPYPSAKADAPRNRVTAEGSIAFDAAAEIPYRINAAAAVDVIDAAKLFTAAQVEQGPVVEGRFSVTDQITGQGLNLQTLLAQRRDEFRLVSKGGVIRLLKTNAAELIPVPETPKTDALAKVGSLVGALFGVKKEYIDSGMNRLSKPTEAVLDFAYQTPEIRYDEFTLTAIRGADQAIELRDIVVGTPNVRLTGTGRIGGEAGRPWRAQPLQLKLQLGAQGRIAQLLTTAGLLSTDKDEHGYTQLRQPIQFGGTLEQIDRSEWNDLLVKAATPAPDQRKKSG